MSTLRLSFLAASLLLVSVPACAPSDVPQAPSSSALSNSPSSGDGNSSSGSKTPAAAGSAGSPAGGTSTDPTQTPTPTATDNAGPCGPLIGKWEATFDDGSEATGDDIPIGSISLSGKLDFTLTHDDADVANVVDFVGTATITALGQTQTYQMQPSTKATGDTKDTTCNGGLHLTGITNVDPIGDIVFTMDGDFDASSSPPNKGQASFTMKTADDNGQALTGKGTAHIVRQ